MAKPIALPPRASWASDWTAAITGAASEVPPIRYSLYCSVPSGKVCVWPTLKPVLGSAIAEMSGTTRLPAALLALTSAFGTTPFW